MGTLHPKPEGSDSSITALASQPSRGDRTAEACLIPQIYEELWRVAARYMRPERLNHTLQPTALVHEAYDRLVRQPPIAWQSRAHFFAVAPELMRHMLADHARAGNAKRWGGIQHQLTLEEPVLPEPKQSVDVLLLNQAIESLTKLAERQARIIELHFFEGLSFEGIAPVLQLAPRTVKRDGGMARAWLNDQLSKSHDTGALATA